jgi:hypothetical protein
MPAIEPLAPGRRQVGGKHVADQPDSGDAGIERAPPEPLNRLAPAGGLAACGHELRIQAGPRPPRRRLSAGRVTGTTHVLGTIYFRRPLLQRRVARE